MNNHFVSFSDRLLDGLVLVDVVPHAPEEGQADVLLGPLPVLRHPQDVLPRHQVQQEQHGPARQVVLQLQVSFELLCVYLFPFWTCGKCGVEKNSPLFVIFIAFSDGETL